MQLRDRLMWPIIYEGMPIQSAIDFGGVPWDVTIGHSRFAVGPPVCGGEIDVATITSRGFHWVRRKEPNGQDRFSVLLNVEIVQMPKPLQLPKPSRPVERPSGSPSSDGASSPSPERIKEAIREANDQARMVSVPPQRRLR